PSVPLQPASRGGRARRPRLPPLAPAAAACGPWRARQPSVACSGGSWSAETARWRQPWRARRPGGPRRMKMLFSAHYISCAKIQHILLDHKSEQEGENEKNGFCTTYHVWYERKKKLLILF